MNRRVLAIVVVGTLLAVGTVALGGAAAGGGDPDRSTVMAASPTKISPWAASEGEGIELTDDIGFTDGNGQIAGRKAGVGVGDTAGSETDPVIMDEPSTEIRSEDEGGVALNTDPVQAGGAGGGVVLHSDPVEAGGLNGGVVGSRSDDAVLAGGLTGGVVGSRSDDTVLAGSKAGVGVGSDRSILTTEQVQAGGRGGIFW